MRTVARFVIVLAGILAVASGSTCNSGLGNFDPAGTGTPAGQTQAPASQPAAAAIKLADGEWRFDSEPGLVARVWCVRFAGNQTVQFLEGCAITEVTTTHLAFNSNASAFMVEFAAKSPGAIAANFLVASLTRVSDKEFQVSVRESVVTASVPLVTDYEGILRWVRE